VEAALLDILGSVVAPEALRTPHARDLVRAVASGSLLFARLVEARQRGGSESVVLELDVECPQLPRHDIRPAERVAVLCEAGAMPEVLALRPDFPLVPHTNLRPWEYPKSLCLYEEPWPQVRLSWTPAGFVERIRWWLAQTARGTLHGDDQPLEPLLLPSADPIVFPSDLLDDGVAGASGYFDVARVGSGGTMVVRRHHAGGRDGTPAAPPHLIATVLRAAPSTHGVIRWSPPTLSSLATLLAAVGLDIAGELRARVAVWVKNHALHRCGVLLVLLLPKRRAAVGPVEGVEFLAVECRGDNLLSLAVKLGVVRNNAKRTRDMAKAIGMKGAIPRPGEEVAVSLSRVALALSRTQASTMNGLPVRDGRRYVAVGVGALGSQVVTNHVRTGTGEWTLIDADTLLPHNLTRHALSGWELGMPKAEGIARLLNATIDGPPIATAIVADVLTPLERAERVRRALAEADAVIDLSASQPVARHLVLEAVAAARRASLFLNPAGTSLVLLAEDAARTVTLDALEMQYYREVIRCPALADHLRREGGGVRYAQSCRDVSSRLPTHLVALHAAIGSQALRHALARGEGTLGIWTVDPQTLAVGHHAAQIAPVRRQRTGAWELVASEAVLAQMHELRRGELPRETGGVLLGSYDQGRKIVYVADVLASPPDSVERPTLYVRGCEGLERVVSALADRSGGQVGYIGEWHSHPDGVSCLPSDYDAALFGWIGEQLTPEGKPGLMAIVCEGGVSTWVVGELECRTRLDK
jgi:hypothetical protein